MDGGTSELQVDSGSQETGSYVEVAITKGYTTKVSVEDAAWVANHTWRPLRTKCGNAYATTYISTAGYATRKLMYLHRMVNKTPDGMLTDHINGDRLDNRRCNLRTATSTVNLLNQHTPVRGASGIRGVREGKDKKGRPTGRYQAMFGKRVLGNFGSLQEAHRYRDAYVADLISKYQKEQL